MDINLVELFLKEKLHMEHETDVIVSKLKKYNYSHYVENVYDKIYFDKNNKIINDDSKLKAIEKLLYNLQSVQYSQKKFIEYMDYVRNLKIIEIEMDYKLGALCDSINLFIDKQKLYSYPEHQQKIILLFAILYPLLNIYKIDKNGYYGEAGRFELGTVGLIATCLGFTDDKIKYSINCRTDYIEVGGLILEFPPIEWKYNCLERLLFNNSPFCKIIESKKLTNNPNKKIIDVECKSLKFNKGERLSYDINTLTVFAENNRLINKKDNDVKNYLLSQKILKTLIS